MNFSLQSTQVIIVGAGRLATELLNAMQLDTPLKLIAWRNASHIKSCSIVVHAGSGRELQEVIAFCHKTNSVLIELATGSALETLVPTFPVLMCPNTNLLMLKFMSMLKTTGHLFKGYDIRVTESHQAEKTSTPGTAVAIAQSLSVASSDIVSVRNPDEQNTLLHIPKEHLARHAFHQVSIQDAVCSVTMETRVYGPSPYASGVSQIIAATYAHKLDNRIYAINEFIENGWV